jgi:predicted permease
MDIASPCLVFVSLARIEVPIRELGMAALAALVFLAVMGVVASLILRRMKLSFRTYGPALTFPNNGNLGLPISLMAFGSLGFSHAVAFFVVMNITSQTVGRAIASGKPGFGDVWRAPIVPAAILGVLCGWFSWAPPDWIMHALDMIGAAAIPSMLIMLGASLATIKPHFLGRSFLLSLVRVGGGAALGLGVGWLFGLRGVALDVFVLQAAMPVAVVNYGFAYMWDNEPENVASLIAISTVISVVTIPLLLAALMASL